MVLRKDQENAINEKQKDSVREETSVVSGTTGMSVPPARRGTSVEGEELQRPESIWEVRSTTVQRLLKSPCDNWHPPECQFYKSESGCQFGDEVLVCTR